MVVQEVSRRRGSSAGGAHLINDQVIKKEMRRGQSVATLVVVAISSVKAVGSCVRAERRCHRASRRRPHDTAADHPVAQGSLALSGGCT